MSSHAYRLELPPTATTCAVFASPHSGRNYPRAFVDASTLDPLALRSSEDAHLDLLVADAPGLGAPLLCALAPRAYVDLNRSADELDPALIEGVRRTMPNPRISSGLGVIPRVVANGRPIYQGKIPLSEAERRLKDVWRPYHSALQRLMQDQHRRFGRTILFDMHSMPHEAIQGVAARGRPAPEVVLGDRFGSSASREVTEAVEAAFAAAGLRSARNTPFAGAYVTQAYGRPARGQHVIQIEIDRSLYMNESTLELSPGFAAFQRVMRQILSDLAAIGRDSLPLAAE
ncbi:N-formylglutamate amidohydrolase [Halodurantibacterium flavum]|uniref:N-formylglutamate amidohydrolase n=1 Tax=Halodurantibacterium flavum TaxID=1382802 RepID=A0ABW4S5E6_9RHOB